MAEKNVLLRLEKIRSHGVIHYVGVLETPCYPATYYGGYLNKDRKDNYTPADNATRFFFRNMDSADRNVTDIVDTFKRGGAEVL